MSENRGNRKKLKKLGPKNDPLNMEVLLEQARIITGKASPQPKMPTDGGISIEYRKGRPYYYRRYYATVGGQRKRKKEYLGVSLPKGMHLRKL